VCGADAGTAGAGTVDAGAADGGIVAAVGELDANTRLNCCMAKRAAFESSMGSDGTFLVIAGNFV
jgi:hypothetical protein